MLLLADVGWLRLYLKYFILIPIQVQAAGQVQSSQPKETSICNRPDTAAEDELERKRRQGLAIGRVKCLGTIVLGFVCISWFPVSDSYSCLAGSNCC